MDKETEDKVNAKLRQKNREIRSRIISIYVVKGMKQKEIAEKLGKKPSEISKWLSGEHNLTLRSLIMLEVILEEDIIFAPEFNYSDYRKE
jgi:transcriptional regulator with XRE-family HTH domain